MNYSFKIKNLIAVSLLSFFSGFAVAEKNVAENNDHPPEATAAQATISFWDMPFLKTPYIDSSPTDRKDGIAVGKLGVDGGDKDKIVKLAQEIADSQHGDYDSLLISHKDKLLFESYYKRARINLPHPQASATKAYTSLALGRAIQLGYLRMADLDKPLVSFLKDLDPTKFIDGAEKITLHQALTMRSGIRISQEQRKELGKNPAALKDQGQVQAYLQHSAPITAESQSFLYSFDANLVMQVLDAVVPGTAKDFIKNELLDKMGITNYRWLSDVSGLPTAGDRVSMTSRAMVKWGSLVINKGKWQGEQLIPADYLAKATSKMTKATANWHPKNFFYGYFWYQTNITIGDKSYDANLAWGGGQRIITVAELDLIVVITGDDGDDTIMTQVSKIILPAFIKNGLPVLSGPYLGQKPPGFTAEIFAPGIVSTALYELFSAFTPDMKEFYFVRYDEDDKASMIVYKSKNNQWHKSIVGPRVGEPFISPDGKTMHLGKRYMERMSDGWSEVKSLEAPFKDIRIMRLSVSSKGTYVFDEAGMPDGDGVIRYSRLIDEKREEPRSFGKEVNTGRMNAHPFIAPDESYLIWDGQRDNGYGGADIYISFRQNDGSWGAAINMGEAVNSAKSDSYATVTPDGKYMLFNRSIDKDNVDIYWVDAQIIETLRSQ